MTTWQSVLTWDLSSEARMRGSLGTFLETLGAAQRTDARIMKVEALEIEGKLSTLVVFDRDVTA